MLGDLAQQEHTSILLKEWTIAAVRGGAVGKTAGCPTHQMIAYHQVRHGCLQLMKIHQTIGNTMVKWGTFRQEQVRKLGA